MIRKKKNDIIGEKDGVQVAVITTKGEIVSKDILKQYQVKNESSSQQITPEKWTVDTIDPPYNLVKLMEWQEQNVVHASCIKVKANDSVGIGYYLEQNEDSEDNEMDKENERSYQELMKFLSLVNPKEDIKAVLKKVFIDYESCGNGYLEVSRGPDNKIKHLYHINAITVRWGKDRKRLCQKIGNNYVWFKLFGNDKVLNKRTGNFVKSLPDISDEANEIIPITQYTWRSVLYGLPEWLPAIYAMYSTVKEREYNIDFFENFGVPAYAVILEGASLTQEVKDEIKKFFETQLKQDNHKTLPLSVPKGATVKFEALNVDVKEASFRMYHKDNRDTVLTAHHVPPYRVGIVEQGQLGGNVATETDRIYLDSVINPRQEDFAWVINELIIKQGFEIEDWKFKFQDINIADAKTDSEIFDKYIKNGIYTPNQVRKKLGLDPYVGGDVYYVQSSLIPIGVSDEAEKEGRETNLDEIPEKERKAAKEEAEAQESEE